MKSVRSSSPDLDPLHIGPIMPNKQLNILGRKGGAQLGPLAMLIQDPISVDRERNNKLGPSSLSPPPSLKVVRRNKSSPYFIRQRIVPTELSYAHRALRDTYHPAHHHHCTDLGDSKVRQYQM